MSNQSTFDLLRDFVPGVVMIVLVIVLYRRGISKSRSVLQKWARLKRFELLQFERSFHSGGFRWWTTSQRQIVFFVRVRDDAGHERSGWVRFGYFAGGDYSTKEPDVIWNEHETNAA
jgi:hypothetical protein